MPTNCARLYISLPIALLLLVGSSGRQCVGQQDSFAQTPINYMTAAVNDPVAQLAEKLEAGEVSLEYDAETGYLRSVLDALQVPVSSQALVFSKTSLQLQRISPRRPRAIYFNDDVYVGYCQDGDLLELAATDSQQGAVFYTLSQDDSVRPKFARDQGQCLTCHATHRTQDVPGYLIRSVFVDSVGYPSLGRGSFTTDHRSPMEERWGGWYVTGNHGSMRHLGNVTYPKEETEPDPKPIHNIDSLEGLVSVENYLSPHSDLVALMVLEHQTQMHNALAAANYETRRALYQSYQMNEILGREAGHISDSAERRIERSVDNVLSYLLLCDEFPLEDAIAGTSGFSQDFQSRAIRDSRGRSLRDLDLERRLFRYPCSYLIYSPAFDGLPDELRGRVLERLSAILSGHDSSQEFSHLSPEDRTAMLEILLETKPEFADSHVVGRL